MDYNSNHSGADLEALLNIFYGQEVVRLDAEANEASVSGLALHLWELSNSTDARTLTIVMPDVNECTQRCCIIIGPNKPESLKIKDYEDYDVVWQGGEEPMWMTNTAYILSLKYMGGTLHCTYDEAPLQKQNRGEYINFSVLDWNVKTSSGIQEYDWDDRKTDVLGFMFGNKVDSNGYVAPAPDIIGLQEIYKYGTQWDDIVNYISNNTPCGKTYAGIIAYRGDTVLLDSEGCAILYNTNKFDLVDNGKFWLRGGEGWPEDPNVEGVASWESSTSSWTNYKRVAIWVILREKATGKEIFVLNTHYNTTNGSSFTTPYYSSDLIKKQINKLNGSRPTIFMGDLNCNPDTSPIKILKPNYDLLLDTRDTARLRFGETYSVNGWITEDNSLANFDYIFTKGDGFKVNTLTIAGPRTQEGSVLSDHNALIADVYLKI